MQLPAFQRPYVWKIRQTLNLLDSIFRGYPISVVYLWEPGSESKMAPKPHTHKSSSGKVSPRVFFVIDGQQRLTSLAAAFGLSEASDEKGRSLECCIDLESELDDGEQGKSLTKLFRSPANSSSIPSPLQDVDPRRVWLREIMHGDEGEVLSDREKRLAELEGWDSNRVKFALDCIRLLFRMLNNAVPCITIREATDKEVVEVFKRLNRGGTGLRQGDVEAANLGIGSSVVVLQEVRDFVEDDLPKRLGFNFSFAFRALVVFHRDNASYSKMSPTRATDVSPVHKGTILQSWKLTSKALLEAMKFVDSEMGWCRRAFLPSANAIIPLAVAIHYLDRELSTDDIQNFRRWLVLSAIREKLGNVESAINVCLREFRNGIPKKSAETLFKSLGKNDSRKIKPAELDVAAPLWGTATQVMFAWLVHSEAKDWQSGKKLIELAREGDLPSRTGQLSVHHIFPREVLSKKYEPWRANWAANYAILSGSSNSAIKDTPPDEVLKHLDPTQRRHAGQQFFSESAGDRLQDYEKFVPWRAEQLARSLNDWLGL